MSHFNHLGRCIPSAGARVFGQTPSLYYVIGSPRAPLDAILVRSQQAGLVHTEFTLGEFSERTAQLTATIRNDPHYANLLHGTCVPFILHNPEPIGDIGQHLENNLLPRLRQTFTAQFPESHFKAVLQGESSLEGQIELAEHSGYPSFIEASRRQPVVGLYFPQAFQEYDIPSQRSQMLELPALEGASICLSGGMDICAALTGSPDLLMSEKNYSPILCMSAYVHQDARLALMLKAYGPHLEFWCMSQMLSPSVIQVSEQWSGGLSIF